MRAFGIGCLWFSDPNAAPADLDDLRDRGFNPATFCESIKKALEQIDSITDVEIIGSPYTYTGWGEETLTDEDNVFFPLFYDLQIVFTIFMPERLREKYANWNDEYQPDHYDVYICYPNGMPVTFIHYAIPDGLPEAELNTLRPSNAVVFIRKYLEERLREQNQVILECLGPSPFHADFFVRSSETISERDINPSKEGYRTFLFDLKANDEADLISKFIDKNIKTLSAYYGIIRYRNRAVRLIDMIICVAQALIRPRPRAWWPQWRSERDIVDLSYSAILEEKLNRIALAEFVGEAKRTEAITDDSLFYPLIEREIGDVRAPPEDVADISRMIEERRRTVVTNMATVLTGFLSGIAGAAIGAVLSAYFAHAAISKQPVPPHNAGVVNSARSK